MEEHSGLGKLVHALVFLAICAAIVAIGWNEPLRYRFMTTQEIAELERGPATPAPQPTPRWVPSTTRLNESSALDRGGGRR